jgi:hypothetical protein
MSAEIVYDMPFAEYAARKGWNYSRIKIAEMESLAALRHHCECVPSDEERVKEELSYAKLHALHMAILEPDRYAREVVACPVRRNPRDKAFQAFMAEHEGCTILTPADKVAVDIQAGRALARPEVREIVAATRHEVSIFWQDGETGLPLKIRIDMLGDLASPEPIIVGDLKTYRVEAVGGRASSYPFSKAFSGPGKQYLAWDIQAAQARAAVYALTGRPVSDQRGVYVTTDDRSKSAWECVMWEVPSAMVDMGEEKRRKALDAIALAEDTGVWPRLPVWGELEIPSDDLATMMEGLEHE